VQLGRLAQYQKELSDKVVQRGYTDLLDFFSQNLGKSLLSLAADLGESYYVFQAFHTEYVEQLKGQTDADKDGARGQL
jgi:hypothetical protein